MGAGDINQPAAREVARPPPIASPSELKPRNVASAAGSHRRHQRLLRRAVSS